MPFYQDARGFAEAALSQSSLDNTARYAAAAGTDRSDNVFWSSCTGAVYGAHHSEAKSQPASSSVFANLTRPATLLGTTSLPALSLSGAKTQQQGVTGLRSLPCPTLYQAKEPEAIADVFRRAGKKALGGGIPGKIRSQFRYSGDLTHARGVEMLRLALFKSKAIMHTLLMSVAAIPPADKPSTCKACDTFTCLFLAGHINRHLDTCIKVPPA